VINGTRLYIGFDNSTDGVQIWRTKSGVTGPSSESDFEQVSSSRLGDSVNNTLIYNGLSVPDGAKDYLWVLSVKAAGDLSVFRTSN